MVLLHMRPEAAKPYLRLQDAIERKQPDCLGDDRYTADHITKDERAELGRICAACPLLTPCSDYAAAAAPPAGYWPGHNLTIKSTEAA